MRVVVTGGRDFDDAATVAAALGAVHHVHGISRLIHGGARGADTLAFLWAAARDIPTSPYLAKWRELGPSAGLQRNQVMIDHGRPELALAFPGGRGTADMVRRLQRARVPVWQF